NATLWTATAATSHWIRHAATRLVLKQFIDQIKPVSDVRASAEERVPDEECICNNDYIARLQTWFREQAEKNEDHPPSPPTEAGEMLADHDAIEDLRKGINECERLLPRTLPPTGAADWQPNFYVFDHAAQSSKGAAGFDGWTGVELRLVARLAPDMMHEHYNLWRNTTRKIVSNSIDDIVAMQLFSWNLAGIPKNEDDSMPIAAGPCTLRHWPPALATAAPEPPTHKRA
ncbi:unnamed protein product, partial [Prorocentrum cordatum]